MTEVWINLVVIRGRSAGEAYRKAVRCGRDSESGPDESLELYGKPAIRKFVGVRSMGVCHDGIQDGAEINWSMRRCTQRTARSLAAKRTQLLRDLEKELGYVV